MNSHNPEYIVGVDIGGTFTDCVVLSESGKITIGKALSTPDDFALGALNAVADAARSLGLSSADEVLRSTRLFFHACTIGDNTFVGPFVEIQRGVNIGKDCKIQSHAFICELVSIGDDCFISHGAMFINDPFAIGEPARGKRELWRRTRIGNRVSIGTNATVMPVTICDGVVIGAGSVVTKSINEPGIYAGNPARFLRTISQH